VLAGVRGEHAYNRSLAIQDGPDSSFHWEAGVGYSCPHAEWIKANAAEFMEVPLVGWISTRSAQRFRIVDMPGIAAGSESNQRYGRYYRHWLSRADTVVWITQANVRAYKQDQIFFRDYSKYVRSGTRLVLALSKADTQVDDLSAADLNSDVLIRKAADATAEIIPYSWAKPDDVTVVPYSIAQEWNLERLRAAALDRQLVETS
jgi:predicted GTPase